MALASVALWPANWGNYGISRAACHPNGQIPDETFPGPMTLPIDRNGVRPSVPELPFTQNASARHGTVEAGQDEIPRSRLARVFGVGDLLKPRYV